MSFDIAFETFGIPGIVLFGLCTVAYKLHQKFYTLNKTDKN